MFGNIFYHDLIRKYVIYFGSLMNDVHIIRDDAQGNETGRIKLPLAYASKDKMLQRIKQDPNLDKESAITLPRMSFEMTNIYYDGDRKINALNKITVAHPDYPNRAKYTYSPVPYNFNFTLYVYVKHVEDGTRVIEQILPYFTPDFQAQINLVPELGLKMDIPITMMSVRSEDSYDGNLDQRRAIIWTLDFIMKGELHGPIRSKPLINFANVSTYSAGYTANIATLAANNASLTPAGRITVQPGLTANGDPTSNSELSIDRNLIDADDNFGFIINEEGLIYKANT